MTKQPKMDWREFDIQSMSATIDRLAVFYSPIKCSPLLPDGDKQARLAMLVKKEEVKLAVPVQKEEVKMATLQEEIVTMQAKVEDCLKPSNSVQLAQPQGGLVSGTMPAPLPAHQPITFLSNPLDVAQPQGGLVSGTTPAPLPACQPTIFLSKPLAMEAVEHADCVVIGGAHKEEIGFQTASQGELIALIPKVEEPVINKEMGEPIVNQEVEQEVVKHVEAMIVAKEEVIVMEDEEETTNKLVEEEEESLGHVEEEGFINHVEEFSFSVEGFEYDC